MVGSWKLCFTIKAKSQVLWLIGDAYQRAETETLLSLGPRSAFDNELRVTMMPDINPIDKHVGGRLRTLREARGLSPEELVRAGRLSIDRLDRLETGRERLNVDDMRRLCDVLGASPADFFVGLNDGGRSAPPGGDLSVEDEGRLLLADFRRIADPKKRRMLMMLAGAFAQENAR